MKHWQEKIPTFNLVLINIILVFLIIAGFIVGPINKMMVEKNSVLTKLKDKVGIDSCYEIDEYTFNKSLYTVKCKIKEQDYYVFVDKNGIVYDRLPIDLQKEQNDYSQIVENYDTKNASYLVIYYNDQIAYWVKSKEYEYILSYSNLDIIMKVRF